MEGINSIGFIFNLDFRIEKTACTVSKHFRIIDFKQNMMNATTEVPLY